MYEESLTHNYIVSMTLLTPSGSGFYSCCTVEIEALVGACKRV